MDVEFYRLGDGHYIATGLTDYDAATNSHSLKVSVRRIIPLGGTTSLYGPGDAVPKGGELRRAIIDMADCVIAYDATNHSQE